jgi:hypothetical protein
MKRVEANSGFSATDLDVILEAENILTSQRTLFNR